MTVQTGATAALYFQGNRVGKVKSFNIQTQRAVLDVTSLGDTDRTFVQGLRQSSGTATLMYDPEDANAVALLSSVLGDSTTAAEVIFQINSGTGKGYNATAFITDTSVGVNTGDVVSANINFQIQGKPEETL